MKKLVYITLILILILPAFTPVMPHGVLHIIHDAHVTHHTSHHEHNKQTVAHHPPYLDFTTYFNDYLHVDLQKPQTSTVDLSTSSSMDIDALLSFFIDSKNNILLASTLSRISPNYRWRIPDKTPVYLSTQRLRI